MRMEPARSTVLCDPIATARGSFAALASQFRGENWKQMEVHRTACVALLTALLLSAGSNAAAQSTDSSRFEVGGQLTLQSQTGGGVRVGWNLTRHLVLESQVDIYPGNTPFNNKLQAVFGVKAGARRSRVGLFGKIRPGIVHRVDLVTPPGSFCAIPEGCRGPDGGNWFALDTGIVLEGYLSGGVIARIDISDMFVPIEERDNAGNLLSSSGHNAQASFGVGIRF